MTKLARRCLFLSKLADLVKLAEIHGITLGIFTYSRTASEQKKLYDEGKSKCDGYIKRSRHQDWLAADVGIPNAAMTDFIWSHDPRYDKLGELAESLGLVWGGRWSSLGDIYHIELGDEDT